MRQPALTKLGFEAASDRPGPGPSTKASSGKNPPGRHGPLDQGQGEARRCGIYLPPSESGAVVDTEYWRHRFRRRRHCRRTRTPPGRKEEEGYGNGEIVVHYCRDAAGAAAGVAAAGLGHCDTREGPVVTECRSGALAKVRSRRVLKWIPASGEHEVREGLRQDSPVRGKGAKRKNWLTPVLRDAGAHPPRERGCPLHGAQGGRSLRRSDRLPPDTGLGDGGRSSALVKLVGEAVEHGIRHRFRGRPRRRISTPSTTSSMGGRMSAAYVEFLHVRERSYQPPRTRRRHHAEGAAPGNQRLTRPHCSGEPDL